jgi:hypothetical protein
MTRKLAHLLESMSSEEQQEVEDFAAFLLARRCLSEKVATEDVSTQELQALVSAAGGFNWLADSAEDVYSLEDGVPVQWPTIS